MTRISKLKLAMWGVIVITALIGAEYAEFGGENAMEPIILLIWCSTTALIVLFANTVNEPGPAARSPSRHPDRPFPVLFPGQGRAAGPKRPRDGQAAEDGQRKRQEG